MRLTTANTQITMQWSDVAIVLPITLILSLSCLPPTWALSDKRLCADEKCEKIISVGTTKITYSSGEAGMLPFKINSAVRVMSKGAGTDQQLWGVDINGRRGYAHKDFIMEKKIFIRENDLKHEVRVAWPITTQDTHVEAQVEEKAAEQGEQKAAVHVEEKTAVHVDQKAMDTIPLEAVQQQTVLNASETSDEFTTTTTSPLDTLKLGILTEQDQTSSSEASAPIAPVQANLQVVDGTELPLEVVPATTERVQNLTNVPKIERVESAEQSRPAEVAEFAATTNSGEKFDDYNDDDTIDFDNDVDTTLDSKINEIPNDRNPTIESNEAIKIENEPKVKPAEEIKLVGEDVLKLQPSLQVGQQTNSSNETNSVFPTEKVTEPIPIAIPHTTETQLLSESRNDADIPLLSVPTSEEKLEVKSQLLSEPQIDADIPLLSVPTSEEKLEIKSQLLSEPQIDADNPLMSVPTSEEKLEIKSQQETAELKTTNIDNKNQVSQLEKLESKPFDEETKSHLGTLKVESVKLPEVIEAAKQPVADVAPPLTPEVKAQNIQENESEAQQSKGQSNGGVEQWKAQDEINAQLIQNVTEVPLIIVETVKEETTTQAEEQNAPKVQEANVPQFNQNQVETVANEQSKETVTAMDGLPVLESKEDQQLEIDPIKNFEDKSTTEKIDVQPIELEPKAEHKVQPIAETLDVPPMPNQYQDIASSSTEDVPVASSLLFKKQNFYDPNEYYKQLQEQQQQLANEASYQESRDANQYIHPLPDEYTTPSSPTFNAYDATYDAEPTPAPLAKDSAEFAEIVNKGTVEQIGLPQLPIESVKEDAELGIGLFSTIMDTVNTFISTQHKKPETEPQSYQEDQHRLLYPNTENSEDNSKVDGYCERTMGGNCHATITLDHFVEILSAKVLDHSLLLLCVVIAAASSLFFIFVYYCFCNSSQEGALLSKLNHLERSLLTAHKENLIVKHDLMTTRTKLSCIEDNSFGSNDMVLALKKQLEQELYEKAKLQEQVNSLDKDLDNAAEAGLELNKMLSEVLNSQNGDEAFMSTVEELQRQLNDQEKIIIEINGSLAEKSRENSELQYTYTESTTRLNSELKSLQQDIYELEMEKAKLQTRIEEVQTESEQELTKALEARNYEMQRLQHQIMELNARNDKDNSDLQTSLAKVEALEDCLKALKKDNNTNVHELITSAKTRGELNAAHKKFLSLQTKLEQELAAKTRLESQLQISSADVEQLKQDFNQSERDKLEAQTRLEVLSGYFREKETQLQKELSLQEAKWLQHQGENASTVETQTLMKNEIQTLKSQNDELRAEIEAQIASHKAQMGTLENRAHESWLAARQSERRCEEAQAEAAGLRRKLTAMASGGGVAAGGIGDASLDALPTNGGIAATELTTAPSPLPLPLPGSPGLLNMPNPLPFLPTPFSPFMGLPPPFLPPAAVAGGTRPPPLGRMRSPPPTSSRDRYSPQRDDRDDYSDYDDYDDDIDDRGWGRRHRDSFMHSPLTCRSLSPSDSRYNYNDTETDFSPPPSPLPQRKGSSRPLSEV